jgi:hypothetical protein
MTIPPFANLLNYSLLQLPCPLFNPFKSNGCAKRSKSMKKSKWIELAILSKGCNRGSNNPLGFRKMAAYIFLYGQMSHMSIFAYHL